jgi:hypothetical protein
MPRDFVARTANPTEIGTKKVYHSYLLSSSSIGD